MILRSMLGALAANRRRSDGGVVTPTEPLWADDFNNPDTLASYAATADVGGTTWAISGGSLVASGGSGNQAVLVQDGVSIADATVAVTLSKSDNAGLVARFVNNSNFYILVVRDASSSNGVNQWEFYRRSGGTFTMIGSGALADWTRGTFRTFKIVAIGTGADNFKLYDSGVLLGTLSDSTHASGKFGFYTYGAWINQFESIQIFEGEEGAGSDPYLSDVVLLMPFDDSAGSTTTATDEANNKGPGTLVDAATIVATGAKHGAGAVQFTTGGGAVTLPSDPDFALDVFTLDMYLRQVTRDGLQGVFNIGAYNDGMLVRVNNNGGQVGLFINNAGLTWNLAEPIPLDDWCLLTLSRDSAHDLRLYIDKVPVGAPQNLDSAISAHGVTVGRSEHNGGEAFLGLIDGVRLTKGVARDPSTYDMTRAWPTP